MNPFNRNHFYVTICAILFSLTSVFAQEKIVKYTVGKGETVAQIAQKFSITPYDIYKLNPDAQNGLKPNTVLLIQKNKGKSDVKSEKETKQKAKTHEVLPKETLFGIEKKYDITDEDLKKANPELAKTGLQIGQILNIPAKKSGKDTSVAKEVAIYHTVLPKETKYSITKQYGISIEELERKNPEIVANLPIGYELIIRGNRPKAVPQSAVVTANNTTTNTAIQNQEEADVSYLEYTVKPKETFYSLSKMFGLTQQQLIDLNPALLGGVQEGMVLKVSTKANAVASNFAKQKVVLTNNNSNVKKTLVLLMPFNIAKNGEAAISADVNGLNNDKFLNMTLDFYSGALMAIDSAKQLGVTMDIKIFDSNEAKSTSNVVNIFNSNDLRNVDAVVGPFYQSNVEKTASILNQNNVPVISPLSKDSGEPTMNLYQSIVPAGDLKIAMFDYLNSKNGNIIAVIDKKRESSRKYILENQKSVKIAPLTEAGGISAEGFKAMLLKDKMNYIILETANTAAIKYTIKTMTSVSNSYQLQLVILEPNETLDTDEIYFENLMKFRLMYPSATRENNSPEAQIFMNNYKKKNKVNPSTYAIRGFDVTFDTMMRLAQDKTFRETADTMITEQIESKFNYQKNDTFGYVNKGYYILYYDTDLTVKEAN